MIDIMPEYQIDAILQDEELKITRDLSRLFSKCAQDQTGKLKYIDCIRECYKIAV